MKGICWVKPGVILTVKYAGYSNYCIATGIFKVLENSERREFTYSFETIGIGDYGTKLVEIKWLSENEHVIGLSNTFDKTPYNTVVKAREMLGTVWSLCTEEFATTYRYGTAKVLYNTGPTVPIRRLKDLTDHYNNSVWATRNQGY